MSISNKKVVSLYVCFKDIKDKFATCGEYSKNSTAFNLFYSLLIKITKLRTKSTFPSSKHILLEQTLDKY